MKILSKMKQERQQLASGSHGVLTNVTNWLLYSYFIIHSHHRNQTCIWLERRLQLLVKY